MSTKDIRPATTYVPCDVCGRTLLRGEKSEVFLQGGHRHTVCELCKPRALQGGWIREGAIPEYDPASPGPERRRGMFGRRRRGREPVGNGTASTLDEALSGGAWPVDAAPAAADAASVQTPDPFAAPAARRREQRARERPVRERPVRERPVEAPATEAAGPREPRHVRAVPTGDDGRAAAAAAAFNGSEHPRTVAGVSRSLGAPVVAIIPDPAHPSLVQIVASWELCWYRYEVDLSSERAGVRLDVQGYELSELSERDRLAGAAADEAGQLHLP